MDFIARGDAASAGYETIGSQLKEEEARKATLVAELAILDDASVSRGSTLDGLTLDLKARAGEVRGLLGRQAPQARQALRKLFPDRATYCGAPGVIRTVMYRRSGHQAHSNTGSIPQREMTMGLFGGSRSRLL